MCAVSNIGDSYVQGPWKPYVTPISPTQPLQFQPWATKQDIEELRKEIGALKRLLKAAKAFDLETGQPECTNEDKVALIRQLAALVGVDVSEVLG